MNRRGVLSAFLGLPVAMRLGRWVRPAPQVIRSLTYATVGEGGMFATLGEAMAHMLPGSVVFLRPGHHEFVSSPLNLPAGVSLIGNAKAPAVFKWRQDDE